MHGQSGAYPNNGYFVFVSLDASAMMNVFFSISNLRIQICEQRQDERHSGAETSVRFSSLTSEGHSSHDHFHPPHHQTQSSQNHSHKFTSSMPLYPPSSKPSSHDHHVTSVNPPILTSAHRILNHAPPPGKPLLLFPSSLCLLA